MRKVLRGGARVIRGVIFIGFSVQIVLGMLWMFCAFARLHSPGRGIVCAGQIAAAALAVWFCAESVFRGRYRLNRRQIGFVTLSVLTFPMILQCLMAPDARVVAAVLLLAECGSILHVSFPGEDRRRSAALGAGCWLAAGLVRGEYLWLGLIPMLFYICAGDNAVRGNLSRVWRRILLVAAVAGLTAGIGSFYQSRGDIAAALADRVAWTTLFLDYDGLEKEYKRKVDYEMLIESTYEATGVRDVLDPYLEEKLGRQEAHSVLREISAVAWREHRGRIVKEIAWDLAGYTASAPVALAQLRGRAYESYTGMNYRQLLLPAPRLGKFYMHYGCWWFMAALALCMPIWLLADRGVCGKGFWLLAATALFCALWYTMSGAGKMDYKNTLAVNCAWIMLLASAAFPKGESRGEDRP